MEMTVILRKREFGASRQVVIEHGSTLHGFKLEGLHWSGFVMGIAPTDRQPDQSGEAMVDVESGDIANHCSSDSNKRWSYLSGDRDLYLRLPVKIIHQGEAPRGKSQSAALLL